MILSTASARPTRNLEAGKVSELFPPAISERAEALVKFLKSYYEHLNSEGLPSYVLNNITREHDIDLASSTYLDAIQAEIAKGVPNSKVLDRVSLYKKIVKYYATRGSEDSAITFFRIFFDEMIEVFYPKDFLFATSSGDWNAATSKYEDRKGFVSDVNKIQDGDYWQTFSYEIRSGRNIEEWQDAYMRMVHPAGLKLFAALILELFRSNIWVGTPDAYSSEDPEGDPTWLTSFSPPFLIGGELTPGFHLPFYQPGWLTGDQRKLKIFLEAFVWANQDANPSDFARYVYITLGILSHNDDVTRQSLVKSEWASTIKWLDPAGCGTFGEITIEEAEALYADGAMVSLVNISSFISPTAQWEQSLVITDVITTTPDGWSFSSYEEGEDEDDNYEMSSIDFLGEGDTDTEFSLAFDGDFLTFGGESLIYTE